MKNEKKQKRTIMRAISTIVLSLAVCVSFVACKEDGGQKRKPSGSSGDSAKTEIELPEVDF